MNAEPIANPSYNNLGDFEMRLAGQNISLNFSTIILGGAIIATVILFSKIAEVAEVWISPIPLIWKAPKTSMKLNQVSIAELAEGLGEGRFTSLQLVQVSSDLRYLVRSSLMG